MRLYSIGWRCTNYCNPITSLDFTNKVANKGFYQFQTAEGAAQLGAGYVEHALSVSPGLSSHTSPATPRVQDAIGTPTPIDQNQAHRVFGETVNFRLDTLTAWAADTGKIRLTILYS